MPKPGLASIARLVGVAGFALTIGGCAQLLGARPLADARAPASVERTTFHTVAVGGTSRGFLLHRPPHTDRAMPLLFVLHGTSANANVVMEESRMNEVADRIGALVVYPNGTGGIPYVRLFWNTEHCCGVETRSGADEAGMVAAIVDTLARAFPVDRSRVGLIGFSDAGTLAYLLACDRISGAVLTSIGVISGELPAVPCVPLSGISTMVFHGTADRNIRYGETAEHVAEWAARDHCAAAQQDSVRGARRADYPACAGGAEVELYTIVDGRHAWPGGDRSSVFAPRPSRDVDASGLFAAFVLDHPRAPR